MLTSGHKRKQTVEENEENKYKNFHEAKKNDRV